MCWKVQHIGEGGTAMGKMNETPMQQQKNVLELEQEHQQQLQKIAEEREQISGYQMDRDYHQWGTSDFYQNVLTPTSSSKIEQELEKGPPSELSKTEKKRWRAYRGNLRDSALRRERFFRISRDAADLADAKLEKVKNPQINDCYDVLRQVNEEAQLNTNMLLKETPDAPQSVIPEERRAARNSIVKSVGELKALLSQLDALSPETADPIQMARLTRTYLEIEAAASGVSAMRKSRLETAEKLANIRASYVFLYHGAATMLTYCLDQLPVNQVNSDEFAKLKGLATAYGVIAARLELSGEYQAQQKTLQEAERQKRVEEESRKQRELEEKLQTGKSLLHDFAGKQPYSEAVKNALEQSMVKRFLETHTGDSAREINPKSILEDAEGQLKAFSRNWSTAESLMSTALMEQLGFVDADHRNKMMEEVAKTHASDLVKELTRDEVSALVNQTVRDGESELGRIAARREFLTGLPYLSRIPSRILLGMERITEMLLADNTGKEFEEAAKLLEEQVSYTLTLVDDFLMDHLSPASRDMAFRQLVELDGVTIVFGNFSEIWNMVDYDLNEIILKENRDVIEQENAVRESLEKYHMTGTRQRYAFRRLSSSDDAAAIDDKLKALEQTILSNQSAFDATMAAYEFSAEKWANIVAWKEETLDESDESFRAGMAKKIAMEDIEHPYIISLEEFLEEQQDAEEIDEASDHSNKGLLKWNFLCRWDGLNGSMNGWEDDVMTELDKLLKNGSMKSVFPFLADVKNLDDLESLTYQELKEFAEYLRNNMSMGIRGWTQVVGVHDDDVLRKVISEMLQGTLMNGQVAPRAESIRLSLSARNRAIPFRIRYALRTYPEEGTGTLRYRHIDETTSTSLFDRKSRVEKRISRFETAAKVWDILKTFRLDQDAIKKIISKGRNSGSGEMIHAEIKSMISYVLRAGKLTVENRKFCEQFETNNIQKDDYINELCLCGLEGFLLDEKNDAAAYRAFTGEKNEQYKNVLREKGAFALRRTLELNAILDQLKLNINFNEEEKNRVRLRMRPFMAGLKNGAEAEEENLRRFGVKNWEEAMSEMVEDLSLRFGGARPTQAVLVSAYRGYVDTVNKRRTYLEQYRDGALRPVASLLMQDSEFWQAIVVELDKPFQQRLDALYRKMETPLKLLNTQFSYGAEFTRQLVEKLGNEFLYGEERTAMQWRELFEDYFMRYCDHEVAGYSITETYAKLRKQDPVTASYLTELLLTDPKGIELVATKSKFTETVKACKANVDPNTKVLNAYIGDLKARGLMLTEADETGFRMHARSKVLTSPPKEFPGHLETLLEEYQQNRRTTLEQAALSTEVMSEKAQLSCEYEQRRNEGMHMDREDRETIRALRMQMSTPGSPLLAALGMQKVPTRKQIERAKEKANAYQELPTSVRNCLYEAILAGRDGKTVERDANWLASADQLIRDISLPDGERLSEAAAGELLTFLYIRHQDSIASGSTPTQEMVAAEYTAFADRCVQINALMNKDVDLAVRSFSGEDERALQDNPALVTQRRMVMEAAAVGLFSVTDDSQFEGLLARQRKYLETAESADRMFSEMIGEYVPAGEERELIRLGLAEYFHADILKGMSILMIREQAVKMLSDQQYRTVLASGARMSGLLVEGEVRGKALMDGVGSTSLTTEETKLHTVATRETLESFLAEKNNRKFREAYNGLDREQRQVFALAVLQVERNDDLPSAQFVRSGDLEEMRRAYAQNRLESYAAGGDFHPDISYDRVMEILRRHDGRMNSDVFDRAMELTRTCIRSRQENLPKDMARLADAERSIRAASAITKQEQARIKEVSTLTSMKTAVLDCDTDATGTAAEIKERFRNMGKHMLPVLVAVLQDRTALDLTTGQVENGNEKTFVNPQEREKMKNSLLSGRGPRIISRTMTQALTTLVSYQLRDDVDLAGRRLKQEDFAPDALTRKTQVDWELMGRAMDLVEEILAEKREAAY